MSRIVFILTVFSMIIIFQNCSEVSFEKDDGSNAGLKAGDPSPGGPEIPDVIDGDEEDEDKKDLEDKLSPYACKIEDDKVL